MSMDYPERNRLYQNHHLDSMRWDHYTPRDDDIIITSAYKSGTTWTQSIVRELIVASMEGQVAAAPGPLPLPDQQSSPWLEAYETGPIEEICRTLAAQQHRRFLKTHLALDGLPYYPQVKYLVLGRDPRDVFMSLWNHYLAYTDYFYALLNDNPHLVGEPLPRAPADMHAFWTVWINRGWFAWEREGYPFWGNMHHTQSYWHYRHLDNVFFLHYHDLLTTAAEEIERIAHFLDIDLTEQIVASIGAYTSFTMMKERVIAQQKGRTSPETFSGGARTFFHQGTNGRWQGLLSSTELAMYEATKARVLTPECARWLEQGRMVLGAVGSHIKP
jgi:aryl sulfotransferase